MSIINKILQINEHRKEQIIIEIAKLNDAKTQTEEQITQSQHNINQLTTELADYKQNAYKQQLTNAKVGMIQINKIKYDMTKIRVAIENAYNHQEQLHQTHKEIQQQITETRAKQKCLLIKEAKFKVLADMAA